MPFDVVGRLVLRYCVIDGRKHQCHMANTIKRLCAAAMRKLPPGMATQPVPK